MALLNNVKGLDNVLANIKAKAEGGVGTGQYKGILKACLTLQRASQLRVPVEFGNLKASAYTRVNDRKGTAIVGRVGYTAAYALFVHESVGMKLQGLPRRGTTPAGVKHKGFYWDPQGRGQAKFLEGPMRELHPQLRRIIREETQKALFK